MDDAKKTALETLRGHLDNIISRDPEQLAVGQGLGVLNFKHAQPLFDNIKALADELHALPLDLLFTDDINGLASQAENLASSIQQIDAFSLKGVANPEQQRDARVQAATQQYEQLMRGARPYVPYLTLKQAKVETLVIQSTELLSNAETAYDESAAYIEERKARIDKVVKAAQDAAAKIGVAQFATRFDEMANDHDVSARKWLKATAAFAVVTVVVILGLLFILPASTTQLPQDASWWQNFIGSADPNSLQRIITKLLVVSLFYMATFWSGRNYRAHRHLAVANRHRQNALTTFETFVNATEDNDIKNAVLLEATHCIFAPAASGYLGKEEEHPSSHVVERVFKTASATTGPQAEG